MEWGLVGRDDELKAIALARAEGQSIVLVGGAGVGKSRLAREALKSDGAWVQATRSAAAVPLGAFAGLVGADIRADEPHQLLPRAARALTTDVVAVDDAHLLDSASAALVLELAKTKFVIATIRAGEPCPDAVTALWKDGGKRLAVDPLPEADVRTLVEHALGDPAEEAALRWIAEVSQGNPLYVRELLDGALAAGALQHDAAFWQLNGHPPTSASLVDLVEQRLEGLTTQQRDVLELLALAEPLTLDQLGALADEDALLEVEALGLITDEIRLAQALHGDVIRAQLPPLRARRSRRRLAEVLDDPLRKARLLLDARAELPPELLLDAARAANRSGDPDLGAELAQKATPSVEQARLLAQAHALRDRYDEAEQILAAVEDQIPGRPDANEYLRERTWVQRWGLRVPVTPLLTRAARWSDEPRWAQMLTRMGADFDAPLEPLAPDASGEAQRLIAAQNAMAAFLATEPVRLDEHPPVPLRDFGDAALLGALSLIGIETGRDWPGLEAYMSQALRDGVHGDDHHAAGLAALTLARLHFLRGRYRDSTRWLAEAEVHLAKQDPFGALVNARSLAVGLACATGDLDAAFARLERIPTEHLTAPQTMHARRAHGWVAVLRNRTDGAKQLLADAAVLPPGLAAPLAYEALRAGAATPGLATASGSPMIDAYAAHARGEHLDAAERFEAIGALRYAVEAASQAASAFVRAGRKDSARRAATYAKALHQEGPPPHIDGLDAAAIELTAREAQIVDLVARGLSNADVADRLVLSVRTVETHLYRAMQKLGVSDRKDLPRQS